jgi:outer membrane protein assembly factor BamB
LNGAQSPGFFTTISSNGTKKDTAVIWAMERPYEKPYYMSLKAFDPQNGSKLIYSSVAGFWPYAPAANANIVPIVANGKVIVATYKTLIAYGLTTNSGEQAKTPLALHFAAQPPIVPLPAGVAHELHGVVTAIKDNILTLRLRDGRLVTVDKTAAEAAFAVAPVSVGHASDVRGNYKGNVFVANSILHQKEFQALWADDR